MEQRLNNLRRVNDDWVDQEERKSNFQVQLRTWDSEFPPPEK